MPVLTVVAAVVIAQTSWRQKSQHIVEVQKAVESLCADLAASKDVRDRLGGGNSDVGRQIAAELERLCNPHRASPVSITVTAGDHPQFGNGSATHCAMLTEDGRDRLGLRVRYEHETGSIQVIGYWTP